MCIPVRIMSYLIIIPAVSPNNLYPASKQTANCLVLDRRALRLTTEHFLNIKDIKKRDIEWTFFQCFESRREVRTRENFGLNFSN